MTKLDGQSLESLIIGQSLEKLLTRGRPAKRRLSITLVAGLVMAAGLLCLWFAAGWLAAVGVFLVAWSHNIEKHM